MPASTTSIAAITLLLAACSRAPDMETCRLVGTWRPVLSAQEETDVWNSTRIACPTPPMDRPTAIKRAISLCTVSFDAHGGWSAPALEEYRGRWKAFEGSDEQCSIRLSESPFGPERTVTCEFATPDELIVRDQLCWFTRFVRVN